MRITVKKDAIYEGGKIVALPKADHIASANGYPFVERLCEVHAGQLLVVDDSSLVVKEIYRDPELPSVLEF